MFRCPHDSSPEKGSGFSDREVAVGVSTGGGDRSGKSRRDPKTRHGLSLALDADRATISFGACAHGQTETRPPNEDNGDLTRFKSMKIGMVLGSSTRCGDLKNERPPSSCVEWRSARLGSKLTACSGGFQKTCESGAGGPDGCSGALRL